MAHPLSYSSALLAALAFATTLPASSSLAHADTIGAASTLAPAQLDAFADVVSDSESAVRQRLVARPDLVSPARAAAEARLHRKHTGKVLLISGIAIQAVGTTIGFALLQTGIRSSNCTEGGCGDTANGGLAGLVVIGLANAVGLGLAIPGIVKLASESDAEATAAKAYRSAVAPAGASLALPAMRPTLGLTVPLLSGTW
jgi:predicted cobalt transporter CbtA